ncbi:MAG: cytochrome d ubiquinol oxidase subunit II [Candidatus Eremiobacteraeota bacterium]|nr:cytochrome d ubiquinol oxidase subunit II [Candidatus Eremiobacteraeota bacterium]
MSVVAFLLVAFMLAGYVVLDGYDLGVASIAPFLARNDRERLASMQAIGPFWNGNEVWLVAAGGILFALFPKGYASSFSGFYLPFIVVLWLLMGRGVALELREHYDSALWHQFWDFCFTAASALLILFFGVALGNLIRGVPLGSAGYFMGTFAFLLNWYALLVGLFALAALALHGATFMVLRVEGAPAERARTMLPRVWVVALVLFVLVTVATFVTRSDAVFNPWIDVLGILAAAAFVAVLFLARRRAEIATFVASSAFLVLVLSVAAATMYPNLLRGYPDGRGSLSIFDLSPSPAALASALGVSIAGMVIVIAYTTVLWRKLAGKVRVGE